MDVQSIGPSEIYYEVIAGGSGGLQALAGEFVFHCHIPQHYVTGMWGFWRVYNTLQSPGSQTDVMKPLVELPDRVGKIKSAVSSDKLVRSTVDWLAYLIKVDGLTIYHSGWPLAALDEYKKEIDYFASESSGVDIAFVWKQQGKDEYYKYLLDKLRPKIYFPDGAASQNIEVYQKLLEPYPDTVLGFPMNPGDRFHYQKGNK